MERRKTWDALSIVAAVLCIGPEGVTSLHLGLPSDLAWWGWLTILPISALLLGMPQLAMLTYVRFVRWKPLRFICLAVSAAMLGYYHHRLTTSDLSSSSTAAVGLFFLVFYMAMAAAAVGAVLLFLDRLLLRGRTGSS